MLISVRFYIGAMIIAGIVSLGFSAASFSVENSPAIGELILLLVLAGSFGWRTFTVIPGTQGTEKSAITLGFILAFTALLRFGPLGATLVGFATVITLGVLGKHQWYQLAFNMAAFSVETLLASHFLFFSMERHAL